MTRWVIPLALAALSGCSDGAPKRTAAPSEPPPAVTVAPVALRPIAGGVSASGILVPREEAAIGAEIAGYRVLRVLAEEGDYVGRGRALAILDPALLRGEIMRAEVATERARSEYARVADLRGKGVIADETIDQRTFEARSAAAQLADLRTRRERLTLRAPVSGLVLSRSLRAGDISGPGGSEPYFRLARDGLLELEAEVPEAQFGRVRAGAPVPVQTASGERFAGTIRLVSPRVDQQSKLGRIRIALPRNPRLRAGGFASTTLTADAGPVPTVPERAVRYAAGGASVAVVGADRRMRRVAVQVGARGGGLAELKSGPPAGTRVIVDGGALVLPGDQVRPVREAAR